MKKTQENNIRDEFTYLKDNASRNISAKNWSLIIAVMASIHFSSLVVSQSFGYFYKSTEDAADLRYYVRDIIERGYPDPISQPPGHAYYLAFKRAVTEKIGIPFWSGKYIFDVFLVLSSGILSIILGLALTGNKTIAITSGLFLVSAPIFACGSSIEEKFITFQPLYLSALTILVNNLKHKQGPTLKGFAAAGLIMGISCLFRANPQFLIFFLFPYIYWGIKASAASKPLKKAIYGVLFFFLIQSSVQLPWSIYKKQALIGESSSSFIYSGIYDGAKRHPGNTVSDWLNNHYKEPGRNFKGVFDFHLYWLKHDPFSLLSLYIQKGLKVWYVSDTGQWDQYIFLLHTPFWILAFAGLVFWFKNLFPGPVLAFTFINVFYFWLAGTAIAGFARYTAPIYGFLGIWAGYLVTQLPLKNGFTSPHPQTAASDKKSA